jgi:predicted GIY-YIG superfamily endonuclease
MKYFTYIIECDAIVKQKKVISYYVGKSTNPKRRLVEHLAGRGARYLRGKRLLRMVIAKDISEHDAKRFNHFLRSTTIDVAFDRKNVSVRQRSAWSHWTPFWQRCSRGCQPLFIKKIKVAVFSIKQDGGLDCPECHGTGGTFLQEAGKP